MPHNRSPVRPMCPEERRISLKAVHVTRPFALKSWRPPGPFIERSYPMRRAYVLALLLGAGSLSLVLAASQPPPAAAGQAPAPMVVEVEKLKDNLFMLKGGGGNTAVFVTSGGVVVVDTKNPGWGKPILDKIKGQAEQAAP